MPVNMARSTDSQRLVKDAQERKRYHNHKAKWAHGMRPLYGQKELREDGHNRPLPAKYRPDGRHVHLGADFVKKRQSLARDIGLPHAVDEAISTRHEQDPRGLTASDIWRDDQVDFSAGDANIFYSFDARSSPDHAGETVLSTALARALERFDEKETDRIIREYDFVLESNRPVSEAGSVQSEQEEDYEFIEAPPA